MNVKSSAIIGFSVVVAAVVLAVVLTGMPRASSAAPAAAPPALQVGRYEIAGVPSHIFVLDTATGEVWEKFVPESGGTTSADFNKVKLGRSGS